MKKGKTFLQRRILPWVLVVVLCVGVIPLSVWASSTPSLLQGKEATIAMEVLYEEDFESESGMDKLSVPEGASAAIQGGALSYTAVDANKPLYILGGEMWGYYTAEADVTLKTEGTLKLAFYVQNAEKMQTVTVPEATKGTTYRVKVVVNGTTASASYATYTWGSLGDWTIINNSISVAKSDQTGSIGFVAAEDATLTIDNIKVRRNMNEAEAKHTLFNANFTNKNTSFYNIKTSGSGISVSSNGDKLSISNNGTEPGVMYFNLPDAAHWKNYVVEVDMFQTAEGGGLLYRVQNTNFAEVAQLYTDNNSERNAELYSYWNGHNVTTSSDILHYMTDSDKIPELNDVHRIKVVVEDSMADLYVASYTGDTLDEWKYLFSIDDIAAEHGSGSVGFLANAGANFWVDNLEVYEYTSSYMEDFEGATDADSVGMKESINMKSPGQVSFADDALTLTGTTASPKPYNGNYDLMWFEAGENWTNYTYEADVTYPSRFYNGGGWNGLAYRVESNTLWERATVAYRGYTNPTRICMGSYRENLGGDASFTPSVYGEDLFFVPADATWEQKDATFRLKVVVKENTTWFYSAKYKDGELGTYNLLAVREYTESMAGAAGMVEHGNTAVRYDNVTISAIDETVDKANVANISIPDTGIVNPSVVVTKVTAANFDALDGSAVAIMHINENMDVLDSNTQTVIGSVSQFMNRYGKSIIPAFYLDNEAEQVAVCSYLKANMIMDAFYVADYKKPELLKQARTDYATPDDNGWRFARGILDFTTDANFDITDKEQRKASRRTINGNLAYIALLPSEGLDVDIVAEYNARTVSVWSYAEDTADVYAGIARGYNGMISTSPKMILDVYASIKEPTLSGKPITIGHGGKETNEADGSGINENTIESFDYVIKTDNAMGFECDTNQTKDNKVILKHDADMSGTNYSDNAAVAKATQINTLTLEEVQSYTYTKSGAKIPTLEDALKFLQKEENDDVVMWLQTKNSDGNLYANTLNSLLTGAYADVVDQVIVFTRSENLQTDNQTTGLSWTNETWGPSIPVLGGRYNKISNGFTDRALDSVPDTEETRVSNGFKETPTELELMESMIDHLAPYNHQQIPYDYDDVSTSDSLTYNMASRGFLLFQSTQDVQVDLDRYYITQMGTTALLSGWINLTHDYVYEIEATDQTLKIEDKLSLEQTVKTLGDSKAPSKLDYGVTWISGDTLKSSGNSYTMSKEGSANVVYYADVTLDRDTDITYRVYSEPVTVTWNETGEVHEHEYSSEWTTDKNYHYHECTCGDKSDVTPHTEKLINAKEATADEAGYTGDLVCPVCEYVIEEGKEIPKNPFAGYTIITPADFGIADGDYPSSSGYKSLNTSLSLADKVAFTMKFTAPDNVNETFDIRYLKYNGTNGNAIRTKYRNWTSYQFDFTQSISATAGIYDSSKTAVTLLASHVAGFGGNWYLAGNVEYTITTEMVVAPFETDGTVNDLQLGVWFNGELYNGEYLYICDVDISKIEFCLQMQGIYGVSSPDTPFAKQESEIPEEFKDYTILTPSDFVGYNEETDTTGAFYAEDNTPLNETLFAANVETDGYSRVNYRQMFYVNMRNGAIRFCNKFSGTQCYIGGNFAKGVYQKHETLNIDPLACESYAELPYNEANLPNGQYATNTLWITVDEYDFKGDDTETDYRVGLWFNGELYGDVYFYFVSENGDALPSTWSNVMNLQNVFVEFSDPYVNADSLGAVAGEYMSTADFTSDTISSAYANKRTFETDVRFEGAGATLYYGSADDAIKFTSTADGKLQLSHNLGAVTEDVNLDLIDFEATGVDLTRNFNLKIRTDKVALTGSTKNDVKLGVWINDMYKCYYISDVAASLTSQLGVQCEEDAVLVLGQLDAHNPDRVEYCLNDGVYKRQSADITRLSLNGVATESVSFKKNGIYRVAVTDAKGIVHRDEVYAYRDNDITSDNEVSVVDLVRLKKLGSKSDTNHDAIASELTEFGKLAVGYKSKALWTTSVLRDALNKMRTALLGESDLELLKAAISGQNLSILGDSISTFTDYSSGAAADTTNSTISANKVWYDISDPTKADRLDDVNKTWWMSSANSTGLNILVNNSYSGDQVARFGMTRALQLHDNTGDNAGTEPDIIAVYMGLNDLRYGYGLGTYSEELYDTVITDNGDGTYSYPTIETYNWGNTQEDNTNRMPFAEAYIAMIHKIITEYDKADVFLFTLLPTTNKVDDVADIEAYNDIIRKVAAHYGLNIVDLYNDSGITIDNISDYDTEAVGDQLHPNEAGMNLIKRTFINALKDEYLK